VQSADYGDGLGGLMPLPSAYSTLKKDARRLSEVRRALDVVSTTPLSLMTAARERNEIIISI
jgi:hypothetical protein